MAGQERHDKIVKDLETRLNNSKFFGEKFYNKVKTHIYFNKNLRGECDCLAIKKYSDNKKFLLLFEVKSNEKEKYRKIARMQLLKDIGRFFSEDFQKAYAFCVYGTKKNYKIKATFYVYRDESKRMHIVEIPEQGYKKRNDKTERFSKE